ncbi:VOC family protein [Streptococcus didelphis]|uniref:VOC family protein n=1 Tax=Streptococcus didelphis TaxID=102886 RepID=UPI0003760D7E|nr:VOC family protein [Streptococcus didelphis]
MIYDYNSEIRLGKVSLYVNHLQTMTEFYTNIIGFSILSQDSQKTELTIDGKDVLLELLQTEQAKEKTYGLYHTAILVPDKNYLGLALEHLLRSQTQVEGAADHGYSEAIYLSDPEGNGIEIYYDKDTSFWDIRPDGQIIGVTDPMDAKSMLDNLTSIPETFKLAQGTKIGHVHLSVKDALASSKLYQKVFSMRNKMTISTASWISSGDYHHHLAFNNWDGPRLAKHEQGIPGLNYITIEYSNPSAFTSSLKNASDNGMTLLDHQDKSFTVLDNDGIQTKVILTKSN